MKKQLFTSFLAFAIAIFTMQSCTKKVEKKSYSLKMSTSSKSITIPATTYTTSGLSYGPSMVSYNVDSFIKAQTGTSLGLNDIVNAKVLSIKFTIMDTSMANNLQNFENMAATLVTDKYTVPLTFAQNNISATDPAYTMSIPVDSNAEIKTYFGDIFSYSVTGKLRKITTADMHCKVEYVFRINVEG
ncbi:MAG: hypothetical protein JWQ38_1120 [Flavipsychrobacter sp.]|nr:hypothetical protein [Flavipsychrobacter sp.]